MSHPTDEIPEPLAPPAVADDPEPSPPEAPDVEEQAPDGARPLRPGVAGCAVGGGPAAANPAATPQASAASAAAPEAGPGRR